MNICEFHQEITCNHVVEVAKCGGCNQLVLYCPICRQQQVHEEDPKSEEIKEAESIDTESSIKSGHKKNHDDSDPKSYIIDMTSSHPKIIKQSKSTRDKSKRSIHRHHKHSKGLHDGKSEKSEKPGKSEKSERSRKSRKKIIRIHKRSDKSDKSDKSSIQNLQSALNIDRVNVLQHLHKDTVSKQEDPVNLSNTGIITQEKPVSTSVSDLVQFLTTPNADTSETNQKNVQIKSEKKEDEEVPVQIENVSCGPMFAQFTNNQAQTVKVGEFVQFSSNVINSGHFILQPGNRLITCLKHGYYKVEYVGKTIEECHFNMEKSSTGQFTSIPGSGFSSTGTFIYGSFIFEAEANTNLALKVLSLSSYHDKISFPAMPNNVNNLSITITQL